MDNVFKSPEIKTSIKNTLIERYGVEHPAQNKEFVEKSKETSLQRYGVEYYTQSEEYKIRSRKTSSIKIESFERENDCLEIQKLIDKYGQGWFSLKLPCLSLGKYKFIEIAVLLGCFCRFVIHFISGITLYAITTTTSIAGIKTANAVLFSLIYNGIYMLPNTILAIVVMAVLRPALKRLDNFNK